MKVFRLCREKYRKDLTGKGAELFGGRWNSKGMPMLYTAQSRALCVVELAVRLPIGILPRDYYILTIGIPDSIPVKELDANSLPVDWKGHPHHHTTQEIGDNFLNQKRELILKVPSAVVKGDFNFLINPAHSDFDRIEIVGSKPFKFDQRLFYR